MIQGKVALVTGLTSGIGLAVARQLAQAGAGVVLNGFGDATEIEKLRAALEAEYGVPVRYSGADMSQPEQITAMVEQAERDLGSVDILVNNAGSHYVKTPLVEGQIRDQAKAHGMSEDRVVREVILASQPNKRFVEAPAIGDIVRFLCSPAADAITGIALPVEGGWTAR